MERTQRNPSTQRKTVAVPASDDEEENKRVQLVTRSFWDRAVGRTSDASRLVLTMRAAERLDKVFGKNWMSTEMNMGRATFTDLNVPLQLRKLVRNCDLENNSPITNIGKYSSLLVARALSNRGIAPVALVASPTLRSIQTAAAIADFLGLRIAIEPGLLEPLCWYRNLPDFSLNALEEFYRFDKEYTPLFTMEKMHSMLLEGETESRGRSRIAGVLGALSAQPRTGALMVVGHAITCQVLVDLASSSPTQFSSSNDVLTSFEAEAQEYQPLDKLDLGLRFPPGCVTCMAQMNQCLPYCYRLCANPVPPFTFGEIGSTSPITNPHAI